MKKNILVFSLLCLIIDQLIKMIVRIYINFEQTITVIPKFFYLTYVKNTGGAFSILTNNTFILIIIALIALIIIGRYLLKKNNYSKIELISYSILLGGILGNFVDRIVYGSVVDYLGFIFGSYYYPIFNFADICIVFSIVLIIIDDFRGGKDGIRGN